jgi:hypothetical protein
MSRDWEFHGRCQRREFQEGSVVKGARYSAWRLGLCQQAFDSLVRNRLGIENSRIVEIKLHGAVAKPIQLWHNSGVSRVEILHCHERGRSVRKSDIVTITAIKGIKGFVAVRKGDKGKEAAQSTPR